MVLEVAARIMMGALAGLNFCAVGLERRPDGKSTRAALIAAWTSRMAPSMSRLMSNCKVTRVEPLLLLDVISVTPEMLPRCRSSGVATVLDITSGAAPDMLALTEMVGRS